MRRTTKPKKKSLRHELESYVIAWNSVLRKTVESMSLITLLRNAHPSYRATFANQLVNLKMLSKEKSYEFISIL